MERGGVRAIKFETTRIHFFEVTFSRPLICSLFGGTGKEQIGMVRAVEFYCSLMRQSLEHTVFSRVQSVAALQREHRCKVGRRPVKAHYGAESVSLFVSSRPPRPMTTQVR